jgi:SAM-dependent methyltransferase
MKESDKVDIWEEAANIRLEQIESGLDISFSEIFLPVFEDYVMNKSFRRLIDVGTGTGHMAKAVSKYVEFVVAIELSPGMHAVAKEVLAATSVELINISSFDYKPKEEFDLVISHMCSHTTPDINKFIKSLYNLVSTNGEIMISVPHPCFYENFKEYFGGNFSYIEELSSNVTLDISLDKERLMPNIPFYHRSLGCYMRAFKDAGLVVTDIVEPWPSKEVINMYLKPWKYPKYCFFILKKVVDVSV